MHIYELPAKEKKVCIVHKGSFTTIGKTYDTLFAWIRQNEYVIDGPVREIYHKGDWATGNLEEYITEMQVSIK